MDRRTILAFLLTALVIFTPMLIWGNRRARSVAPTDTASGSAPVNASAAAPSAASPAAAPSVVPTVTATQSAPPRRGDTTAIDYGKTRYTFSTAGGTPQAVTLAAYRNLAPSKTIQPKAMIGATVPTSGPGLLRYRVVRGADTVALDTVPFQAARSGDVVTFTSSGSLPVTLRYQFTDDGYLTHVSGQVDGTATQLLIDLPSTLRSQEADTLDDERHLAYGYKLAHEDVKSVAFTKLDPSLVRTDSGPMTWVAARNKYFLIALIAPSSREFVALRMQGGLRVGRTAPTASATAILPIRDGRFGFDIYAGPQSWSQLRAIGQELENVNPYGGWIPGVQPFAAVCMRVLLWIRQTFNVSYGWVLIIFGFAVRLLLWPLNQSAMRSSLKMQRIQPELAEVQKRYKADPEKQRTELVKLYQQHGMSPFSPVMGCLPMLLPMPVLFALFFVFQNTIEFRGVSFLWLPDLSLGDPYFIMPIVMGITMFALSWIGMRAAPPNPQTKMMSYMMPAVMTAVLWKFASGLNLYYAVQNIAALPQQLLLTRERMKAAPPAATPAPLRSRRATT
ncbi:MAG TPA: membrane protein insertase YidC [Gemmatimonadaceae bacterium]|jgi:YidC/Oxa1 family membrane protein insertase